MPRLSEHDLIHIWETGLHQHPIDRALTILVAARPALTWDDLAALSLGQRDGCLLQVWEQTFGPQLDSYAECPQCCERLEFQLSATQLRSGVQAVTDTDHIWHADEYAIRFRLPNSHDLAAIVACSEPASARQLLLSRCVLAASRDGAPMMPDALPATIITGLAEHLATCDPLAEILLDLVCPACDVHWQAQFDIAAFLWAELAVAAKRLLRDVHTLARAYGWREADILALSAVRRQCYLSLVS